MKNPSAMSSVTILAFPSPQRPEKVSIAPGVSLAVSVVTSGVEANGVVACGCCRQFRYLVRDRDLRAGDQGGQGDGVPIGSGLVGEAPWLSCGWVVW